MHTSSKPSIDDRAQNLKNRILTGVKEDLAAIEIELANQLQPRFDLVKKVAGHILFSGGKRLDRKSVV